VLDVFPNGGSTRVSTADLGKPAPGTDGLIRVDFVALLSTPLTPGVVYEAVVSAVGPGGSGAGTRSNTFSFSVPCAPTLAPASANVGAAAGSGTVSVTVATGCVWNATSNANWITLNGTTGGNGNGTVNYSLQVNTSTSSRVGTVTIAGLTFSVTQAGTACAPAFSPTSANVGASATTGSVAVVAASGCGWTAVSNAGWITLTGTPSGSGDGTVSYSLQANASASSRVGTVTIGSATYTVTQAAAGCSYTLSALSAEVSAARVTYSVTVSAPAGCAWSAVSHSSWITITAGANDTGSGSVIYRVSANHSVSPRTGTMTIAGATFTVTQLGTSCTVTILPTSANVGHGASTGTVAVTAPDGCGWTAVSNANWIDVTSGASGSGAGTVAYSVDANAGAGRSGTVTVGGNTFTVNQAAEPCSYSISPAGASLPASGGGGTVNVTTTAGCTWTASSPASWVTIGQPAGGTGSGSITFNALPNAATSPRSATLTIAGRSFVVTEPAAACTFTVSPLSVTAPVAGTTGRIDVTTQSGCTWLSSSGTSWVTLNGSGTGSGHATYTVLANAGGAARSGTVHVAGVQVNVQQAGPVLELTAPKNLRIVR
jgi:hypothetical protein